MIEIAGPERLPMSEFVRRCVDGIDETRDVIVEDTAPYFGVLLEESWLTPEADAWLGRSEQPQGG